MSLPATARETFGGYGPGTAHGGAWQRGWDVGILGGAQKNPYSWDSLGSRGFARAWSNGYNAGAAARTPEVVEAKERVRESHREAWKERRVRDEIRRQERAAEKAMPLPARLRKHAEPLAVPAEASMAMIEAAAVIEALEAYVRLEEEWAACADWLAFALHHKIPGGDRASVVAWLAVQRAGALAAL